MEKYWFGGPANPENIILINGCAPAMEFMMNLLCEEYDTVIIPTPTFAVFFVEWWARSRVIIEGAHCKEEENFAVTRQVLDEAFDRSFQKGKKPKMLALIQPNNPTGKLLSHDCLKMCLLWAYEKDIHIVCDEIYAITIFQGQKMISMAGVIREFEETKKKDEDFLRFLESHVHIAGGFSKDFSLNGLRTGLIYTKNKEILKAASEIVIGVHQYMANSS